MVQLAVQGSKTKVSHTIETHFEYQNISGHRDFKLMNIHDYDIILGTLWIFQHQVTFGLNPPNIIIGCSKPQELKGNNMYKLKLSSVRINEGDRLTKVHQELMEYTCLLFKDASETLLPPLQTINHSIPLIDENICYP